MDDRRERQFRSAGVGFGIFGLGVGMMLFVLQQAGVDSPLVLWSLGVLAILLVLSGGLLEALVWRDAIPDRFIPFEWVGFRGETKYDQAYSHVDAWNRKDFVRRSLQVELTELWRPPPPPYGVDLQKLRATSARIHKLLTDEGFHRSAEDFVVTLNDDASPEAVQARWAQLDRELANLLLLGEPR